MRPKDVWIVMAAVRPGDQEMKVSGVFSTDQRAVEHMTDVHAQGRDAHLARWAIDAPVNT